MLCRITGFVFKSVKFNHSNKSRIRKRQQCNKRSLKSSSWISTLRELELWLWRALKLIALLFTWASFYRSLNLLFAFPFVEDLLNLSFSWFGLFGNFNNSELLNRSFFVLLPFVKWPDSKEDHYKMKRYLLVTK